MFHAVAHLFTYKLFVFLSLCGLTISSLAQNIPPKPEPARFVNDLTQTLSTAEAQTLETKLKAYNDSTSTQIVILFINQLDGQDVNTLANQIARNWGIGQKDKNNGILILIAKNDRKIRLELGYGIEDKITDLDANYVIKQFLTPNFREGAYFRGLDWATDELFKYLQGEYQNDRPHNRVDISQQVKAFWELNYKLLGAFLIISPLWVPLLYIIFLIFLGSRIMRTRWAWLVGCGLFFALHAYMIHSFKIWADTTTLIIVGGLDTTLGIILGYIFQQMALSDNSSSTYSSESSSSSSSTIYSSSSYSDSSSSYSDSSSSYSDSSSSYSDSSFGGGDFGGGGSSGDW
jgi:uncharacterized membrane protein YgcG